VTGRPVVDVFLCDRVGLGSLVHLPHHASEQSRDLLAIICGPGENLRIDAGLLNARQVPCTLNPERTLAGLEILKALTPFIDAKLRLPSYVALRIQVHQLLRARRPIANETGLPRDEFLIPLGIVAINKRRGDLLERGLRRPCRLVGEREGGDARTLQLRHVVKKGGPSSRDFGNADLLEQIHVRVCGDADQFGGSGIDLPIAPFGERLQVRKHVRRPRLLS